MAQRTTVAKLQAIIETDSDIGLQAFIDTASVLIDWLQAKDAADEAVLTAGLLERIECHVAAHLYEYDRDPNFQSKSTGGASGSFTGQTAMVLMGTRPGQMACLLDVSGKLAQRSKEAEQGQKAKASCTWAGTEYNDDGTFVTDD